ncbi:MAG: carboxypeptidase regulatory-like domain-containing protein [Acidobacteriota bacterium]|nr:MAG: carboxypeptidase regulatory-like domain-containing protein [Acidobacteriota bacterium]
MRNTWLNRSIAVVVIAFLGVVGSYSQVETKRLPNTAKDPTYTQQTTTDLRTNADIFGVVRILGTGFIPSESIGVFVETSFASLPEPMMLGQWNVFADGNGNFETRWFMMDNALKYNVTAIGSVSGKAARTGFGGTEILLGSAADLCQCRNGPNGAPEPCTGTNWVNGNLNGSQAHYLEGESVPYRLAMTGLTVGPTHTVTIEYDTTEGGKHAIDYLTSFDRTETDASPCDGTLNCDPLVHDHFEIPIDVNVTIGHDGIPGTADDIAQVPGAFTIFNGTVLSVSNYTMLGTFAGKSQVKVSITFTNTDPNVVLAWGGHIATRADWGVGNSAVAISGAPFHMRLIDLDGSGGNQDRGLQANAVIYPGRIEIIKDAQPDTTQTFLFTAVGPGATGNFTLDDDGDNTNTYSNTQAFANLTNFGNGHEVTVTESADILPYSLSQIVCTSDPGGGTGTNNNTISIPQRQVVITLEEGEFVTCTFINGRPTSADLMLSGRITDTAGLPVRGAIVQLFRISNGETYALSSSTFGYYAFRGLAAGESYAVTVTARRYRFDPPLQTITIVDNMTDVNFVAIQK